MWHTWVCLALLEELEDTWQNDRHCRHTLAVWRRNRERITPFLAYPEEIRRVIYTTNTVESLHMQIRKTIKTRGHSPTTRPRSD